MKNKKQQPQIPSSASGSAQGQPVAPANAPQPETEPEAAETEAIPIGMPVSPEELRRLKSLAEQPQAPPEQAAGETGKQPATDADEDEPEA